MTSESSGIHYNDTTWRHWYSKKKMERFLRKEAELSDCSDPEVHRCGCDGCPIRSTCIKIFDRMC